MEEMGMEGRHLTRSPRKKDSTQLCRESSSDSPAGPSIRSEKRSHGVSALTGFCGAGHSNWAQGRLVVKVIAYSGMWHLPPSGWPGMEEMGALSEVTLRPGGVYHSKADVLRR